MRDGLTPRYFTTPTIFQAEISGDARFQEFRQRSVIASELLKSLSKGLKNCHFTCWVGVGENIIESLSLILTSREKVEVYPGGENC